LDQASPVLFRDLVLKSIILLAHQKGE
jgi:hypothetical protein